MNLTRMTWSEVDQYLQHSDTLLIPVGTCEQHGFHSPLGTDAMVVDRICTEVAEKFNLLVAPAVNYGVHFDVDSDYPGAASLKPETLKALFTDLAITWKRQGFKKLIIITFHAVPEHYRALEELSDLYYLVKGAEGDISDLLDKQDTMIHSCEAETSVMLHLCPEMVDMTRAVDTGQDLPAFMEHLQQNRRFDIRKFAGNLGFSTFGTPEKGKKIFNRLMGNVEKQIEEILGN